MAKYKFFKGSGWTLFTVFIWELLEEGLENLIAYAITSAALLFTVKLLSTITIVTLTQGLKVALKRFFGAIVKKITYKEGNDKMNKLKTAFNWIKANKCTILGVATGATIAVSGTGVIDVNSLPALLFKGFNVTPILYYALLGVLTILASFFPETYNRFLIRMAQNKAYKEDKEIEKEALKEIQAEREANDINAIKAEQERKARIEAKKRELLQQTNEIK